MSGRLINNWNKLNRIYRGYLSNKWKKLSGPKSNFVIRRVILHYAPPPTLSNASNALCCKLYMGETDPLDVYHIYSDIFAEQFRSVRNNNADKPVARHFNSVNHSISNMNVCAVLPISSCKRQKKRLLLKIGTIHPHGLNERFYFIWSLSSFCFCLS